MRAALSVCLCPQDPTNLPAKLQKHQGFEDEVAAYQPHMESIQTAGQGLVDGGHYAADVVQNCLLEIGELWNELTSKMAFKGEVYALSSYIRLT